MLTTQCDREFEQALLSLSEVCCAVAQSLTKDPLLARELAEETLLRAWAERNALDLRDGLKMVLLSRLRKTYLAKYQGRVARPAESREDSPAYARLKTSLMPVACGQFSAN